MGEDAAAHAQPSRTRTRRRLARGHLKLGTGRSPVSTIVVRQPSRARARVSRRLAIARHMHGLIMISPDPLRLRLTCCLQVGLCACASALAGPSTRTRTIAMHARTRDRDPERCPLICAAGAPVPSLEDDADRIASRLKFAPQHASS